MSWPIPDKDMCDLDWHLIHSENITKQQCLAAASVIGAYMQMVLGDTPKKRNHVVKKLKMEVLKSRRGRDEMRGVL
jgi:hypothetical protein